MAGSAYSFHVTAWDFDGIITLSEAIDVTEWDGEDVWLVTVAIALSSPLELGLGSVCLRISDKSSKAVVDPDDALLAFKCVHRLRCSPAPSDSVVHSNHINVKDKAGNLSQATRFQDSLSARLEYLRMGFPNHWCTSGFPNATSQDGGNTQPSFATQTPCPPSHPGPAGIELCSQLFVNVGTWPLASGWNVSDYQSGLSQLMSQLRAFSARYHVPILFLSTPLSPLQNDSFKCSAVPMHKEEQEPTSEPRKSKPTPWARFPHFVMQFNDVAKTLVGDTKGGVTYLDMIPAILPLFDLSFDGYKF